MKIVYHGSSEHGIKRIEPKKSTHGTYVYATPSKVLALHFSKRCGDDLTYELGRFDVDENGPWELVENIPMALEQMYSNSSSIYSLPAKTFKDINTGFEEVVSEVGVDVIKEEYCESVYEGLLEAEQKGLVKIYRYPNKHSSLELDGSYILDKWRFYRKELNKEFTKEGFDRLIFLHPSLLQKINELAKEFNYDYHYESNDLVDIFLSRIQMQLDYPEYEEYIESAYISFCEAFYELKATLDENIATKYPYLQVELEHLYIKYKKAICSDNLEKNL